MKKNIFLLFLLFCFSLLFSQRTVGLLKQTETSREGYILFAPLNSKTTYLIDKCGKQVHSWNSKYTPGQSVYLLNNGDLLRTANDSNKTFSGGGRIERLDWNSNVTWSYTISDSLQCQHHDIYPLPNGNILVLVWEKLSREEAIKSGRDPGLLGPYIWSEKILELKPIGKNKATVVWQWRIWDHLVQNQDPSKSNYGNILQNPQLVDLNFLATTDIDWLHFNSVVFNAELDQILVSIRNFSEVFVIDHSTSVSEAASHHGGKQKKGGDLLYRWGNPQAYHAGNAKDQKLFKQHSAHWIEKGLADAGKIMIFNNGLGRADTLFSSVEIIAPPLSKNGFYIKEPGTAFLPELSSWSYCTPKRMDFFSKNVSNAQRLSNGNTLISAGASGTFFEIDPAKNIVWKYVNPVTFGGSVSQGTPVQLNPVFRCLFYEKSCKALVGKKLNPLLPIETGSADYPCIMNSEISPGKK